MLGELRSAEVIGKTARVNAEILAWQAIHGLAHLLVSGMLTVSSKEVAEAMSDRIMLRVINGLKELGNPPTPIQPAWEHQRQSARQWYAMQDQS